MSAEEVELAIERRDLRLNIQYASRYARSRGL